MNFDNCRFIWQHNQEHFIEQELYSLEDLACYYRVNISKYISGQGWGAGNKAALKIINDVLKNGAAVLDKFTIETENEFKHLGIKATEIIDFYCRNRKRGDVAVVWHKSTVCATEVHSSPFVCTVRKLVYGIIDLIRLAKGHGVGNCTIVGFALPKLAEKRSIIKVSVAYKCAIKTFKCRYETVNVADFATELKDAIK